MSDKYLIFNGKYYDIGTKVVIETQYHELYEATFNGYLGGNPTFKGKFYWVNCRYDKVKVVRIIDPIEVQQSEVTKQFTTNVSPPPSWDVEIGWVWYIIIMLVGTIFIDRWIIWIFATVYFFLWKNGYLNGGKK